MPLYRKIADELLQKINSGELPPDEKLPAIRTLAAQIGVNNTTVVSAYKFLEQKRAVYSIVGSGTFVARKPAPQIPPQKITADCINFATTQTDPAFFPTGDFRRAFDAVLARDGANAFDYAGWHGYFPLREAVSELLSDYEITAAPENIRIISDIRQGLEIALDALVSANDTAILEAPAAEWATAAFAARGIKILEAPLSQSGIDTDKFAFLAKKHRPKIFFLMPTYQTPTGLCYNESAKAKILEIADKTGAYIIEADICNDFFYAAKPTPMKAAAPDRVIYLKSFDRILTSGLAGCMACPEALTNYMREIGEASGYIQRGLDFYFRNSDFRAHCNEIRKKYSRRYRRAITAAEAFLAPYTNFTKSDGGLSLWFAPKALGKDFFDELFRRNVFISPGEIFGAKKNFRLSFANVPEEKISAGIGIIASVLKGG